MKIMGERISGNLKIPKGVLNLMISVITVRRRGIGRRNVLRRSIRKINLGLVMLLLQ